MTYYVSSWTLNLAQLNSTFNALKSNHVGSLQGFGAGMRADMILNTMAWSRREVVVLQYKQAASVGTYQQVDAAGNCLGILSFYLRGMMVEILYVTKVLMINPVRPPFILAYNLAVVNLFININIFISD